MSSRTCLWLLALVCGASLLPVSAAAAPLIAGQDPCGTPAAPFCRSFDHDDSIPVIRRFSFRAPSAGLAQVTFNGWLYCGGPQGVSAGVFLMSQIVTSSGAIPAKTGPGGGNIAVVLQGVEQTSSSAQSFNLSSTRVIRYASGGLKTVFFKSAREAMSPGTGCSVGNAAFSVVFIP